MKLNKRQLEEYLGKLVRITLFDDDVITGELHKTSEEQFKENPNLYCQQEYYFLTPDAYIIFKSSHVKKLEEIRNAIK